MKEKKKRETTEKERWCYEKEDCVKDKRQNEQPSNSTENQKNGKRKHKQTAKQTKKKRVSGIKREEKKKRKHDVQKQ